jgi:hypothetical protein
MFLIRLFVNSRFLAGLIITFAVVLSFGQAPKLTSEQGPKESQSKAGGKKGATPEQKPKVSPKDTPDLPKTPEQPKKLEIIRIDSLDENAKSITGTICATMTSDDQPICNGDSKFFSVDKKLWTQLHKRKKLDLIRIDPAQVPLTSTDPVGISVSSEARWWTLTTCLLIFFLVAVLATRGHPLKFILGEDGRYSNSKLQMALWFWIVMSVYLAVIYLRVTAAGWEFFGHVNIPANLLLLSGMSALTFAGAKGITTAKVNEARAAPVALNPKDPAGVTPHFWTDLLQNDKGFFDFGDSQMLVVTLLAVGMYLVLIFNFLGVIMANSPVKLPDLDTTILATFGLGQGAYLAKKAVGNAGTS